MSEPKKLLKEMSELSTFQYNCMVETINRMDATELQKLIESDNCPYEPEHLMNVPLGMFHCPVCRNMVLAGAKHPRQRDLPDLCDSILKSTPKGDE